jgi:hypothetical protein
MSPYATELAHARLGALRELVDALNAAEDPAEKRRCAVAIFNAPDPCDIDDAIELDDDEEPDPLHTPGMSESSSESRGYPNTHAPEATLGPATSPPPQPAERATVGCQPRQPLEEAHQTPVAHEMGERSPHPPSPQPIDPDAPTASPEDLATLRSLMSADDATIDRALRAEPRLMSLLSPANLAAACALPLTPT